MTLFELITNAKNGDSHSEKELYTFLFVRFTYLAKRIMEVSDAEDIAQEACMTILEKYKKINDLNNYESWVYKILRNKIGNYIQKKKNQNKHLIHTTNNQHNIALNTSDSLLKYQIESCLKSLFNNNKRYYDILMMSQKGFTTTEICLKFKIKPSYLYVILERSRKKLQNCLKEKRMENDGK